MEEILVPKGKTLEELLGSDANPFDEDEPCEEEKVNVRYE